MKRILYLATIAAVLVLSLSLVSCYSTREGADCPFLINEICYGNGGDPTGSDYLPAFIEFYNPGDCILPLDSYFISDDERYPGKFLLKGYTIPAFGYLVIEVDPALLPVDLSMYGVKLFLTDGEGRTLQSVAVPPLGKGKTYSLQPDGDWHIADPSPLAENLEGVPYVVEPPAFSKEAGFYDDPFDLELEASVTCRIYYTTDGSVPDENSNLYTGAVRIEDATLNPNTLSMRTDITIEGATPPDVTLKKATIICAVAIDWQGNRSEVVAKSFFVGFHNYREYMDIPVISVIADPADLFDIQDGIYVRGKTYQDWLENGGNKNAVSAKIIPTNYRQTGPEWVVSATIQEFDSKGNFLFSQIAGLGINENGTRDKTQKPFDLYARTENGDFGYAMIPDSENTGKYILRINPGTDSIVHELLDGIGIPVSGSQPCLCFLNGEFWGFYELREELDGEYISEHYGVDRENLIVVKDNQLENGEPFVQALGFDVADVESIGINEALNAFFAALDTSTEEGYRVAESIIDVENYLTYVVANIFFNNCDFLNEYTFWRSASTGEGQYNDGRLRWIIGDMDNSFLSVKSGNALAMLADNPIFVSLWNNESFRTRFFTVVMDFANVLYTTAAVKDYVTGKLAYYNPYYRITSERFMESDAVEFNYDKILRNRILNFLAGRRIELISQCGAALSEMRDTRWLTVSGLTEDTKLMIDGHMSSHDGSTWEGEYFTGCEVTFEVRAIPGYRFCGWYENGTLLTDQQTVTVSSDLSHELMPVFESIPVVAVMDRINFARSNFRGGYELYNLNTKSGCVLVPDAGLESSVNFTAISFSSDGEWQEGTGFTISFPTNKLSSCGMILWFTISEGCPEKWNLFYIREDGKKVWIDCDSEPTDDGLMVFFELPVGYTGLPEVELHMESAEDCAGGTVKITEISLYGYGI